MKSAWREDRRRDGGMDATPPRDVGADADADADAGVGSSSGIGRAGTTREVTTRGQIS